MSFLFSVIPSGFIARGLLVDVGLIIGMIILVGIGAVWDYDGQCGLSLFFGSARHPCSFVDHLGESFNFLIIFLLLFWWVAIPVLFVPPAIGWYMGRRSRSE